MHEGDGQPLHAPEDAAVRDRSTAPSQHRADADTRHRQLEQHGQAGHPGGDHPHQCADALDRDDEERSAVGGLG